VSPREGHGVGEPRVRVLLAVGPPHPAADEDVEPHEQVSRRDEYERIFELERKLGSRPELAAVARYIQVIARHSCALSGEETGP